MLFGGQSNGDGGGSNTIFKDYSPLVYNTGGRDQTVSHPHCCLEFPPILNEGHLSYHVS